MGKPVFIPAFGCMARREIKSKNTRKTPLMCGANPYPQRRKQAGVRFRGTASGCCPTCLTLHIFYLFRAGRLAANLTNNRGVSHQNHHKCITNTHYYFTSINCDFPNSLAFVIGLSAKRYFATYIDAAQQNVHEANK